MPETTCAGVGHRASLEVAHASKQYGRSLVLDDVSLTCRAGAIHALIGENGAGKSTLVNILNGIVKADKHLDIRFNDQPLNIGRARDAHELGIATAFQEFTHVLSLTVGENLVIGSEPRGVGRLVWKRDVYRCAAERLASVGIDDIQPRATVGELPLAAQQRLEIARALSRQPRILILDEPTAALGPADSAWLFDQVTAARDRGVTIIYVSHRLAEVRELCDEMTVLRNGRVVTTVQPQKVTEREIVEFMLGRSVSQELKPRTGDQREIGPPLIRRRRLESEAEGKLDVSVRAGEIVGVAALEGHGQEELFMNLFGADRGASAVEVDGRPVRLRSPRHAIRHGIGMVPGDRKKAGVFLGLSISANLLMPSLSSHAVGRLWRRVGREEMSSKRVAHRLNLSADMRASVSALSGGNQQKVVIGKWLPTQSRVLLMLDPTRGIDVGTKLEVFRLMREVAESGGGLLFYSTDLDELVSVCDRILVLREGEIVKEFDASTMAKDAVLSAMLGADNGSPLNVEQTGLVAKE